jgi:hypothetical protein
VFSSGQFLVEMLEVAFHTHSTMTWSLWCAEDPTGLPVEQSAGGGGGWQHGKKVSTDGIGKKVFRGCFLKALALPREGRVPFLGGHVAWGLGALRKG